MHQKGAPGPVKTLHISWRLQCCAELTSDLMPGMRWLQIHYMWGKGENDLSHHITFSSALGCRSVCHCVLTLDIDLQ